ncbi:zinc-dependent alcohol dehydrogenase family protein [Spongisporangium articulatum]|uniref:Zinc-dependent alcohol dehydrogenase family protein n=1 Tax=Spongisporangium articulatum TaxID=3362603 RepID=A0ABW8ANE1_9ACTN
MKATLLHGERDIRLEEVPDPTIKSPTDAVVRVVAACVCGSDLWGYRGIQPTHEPRRIGHEFVGIVEEVGADVRTVRKGQFVIAPFMISDGTCPNCHNGVQTSCLKVSGWGHPDREGFLADAGQGEWVRVPLADGTLVATPEVPDAGLVPSLLTLSDVMGTGHHAALAAGVGKGSTVAVVGDGAVGQCAVIAANRLGAERVVVMSRHADRQKLAKEFGATDVVAARGDEGAAAVRELFDGIGADAVLECVGTKESMDQAIGSVRPGGTIGYVGLPHGVELNVPGMFYRNVNLHGGVAPVRAYLEELLSDVLHGSINPGKVFDLNLPLTEVAEAYAAMDERRAIKSFLNIGSV